MTKTQLITVTAGYLSPSDQADMISAAYHSGKCILLVFFLQEDECVCEKECQDICGSEDKPEFITMSPA